MKRNEIIVYEHKKGVKAVKYNKKPQSHIEPPKPTNPVAKNANAAIGGGAAGAHKDAKKASQAVRGQKHKNAEMAEGWRDRRDAYQRDYDSSVAGMGKRDSLAYQLDGGANDEGWDEEPRQRRHSHYTPQQSSGMYFYNVPPEKEGDARLYGLRQSKSGKWYSKTQNTMADKLFGPGRYWKPKNEATGDAVGTVSSTTPDGKVKIKTATGDEIETSKDALIPGASGTLQMKPDAAGDTLKPGAKVVSTEDTAEEDMLAHQNDSESPIHGEPSSHKHILVLKKLAGL